MHLLLAGILQYLYDWLQRNKLSVQVFNEHFQTVASKVRSGVQKKCSDTKRDHLDSNRNMFSTINPHNLYICVCFVLGKDSNLYQHKDES